MRGAANIVVRPLLAAVLALFPLAGCAGGQEVRIVSLSPSATEILYAVGAGDQIVAVDEQSSFPADAKSKINEELSGLNPNVERILGLRPTLVVLSERTPAAGPNSILPALEAQQVGILLQPAPDDLEGVYAQIGEIGRRTGHEDEAARLVESMRKRIDETVAATPKNSYKTYYHELDNAYFSITSNTFIGSIYKRFNLRSIADKYDLEGGGYPQLTAEQVRAEKPDLIFLADKNCCGQSPKTVAARSNWQSIPAVRNRKVVALDDDVASRWGPRLQLLVEEISKALR
ncbi:ABC transporter substrate-binding protein [Nonomuraea sp. K274]|uniref:ABC transporter substrate-binding protein n=1 Tax=Nonomuraea cypriaca TaxID=1187855 RepID=A0A931ADS8_9ACTN|nr:ABC transporter substrate-binding protein [Nonomuraea cypriaca]MBF8188324.1 ABC transporter substrate-binding protein [Nonomuraea cypriaca]